MALNLGKGKKGIAGSDTIINSATPFDVLEAYKLVRANLLFSLAPHEAKAVVISSALPGEGKSTTCANIALTMAQTGSRVLLIDADLRKPIQHKIFKLPNGKGLSNLLVGFDGFSDILHAKVAPKLDVITSGQIPPNPSELVGSVNMQVLMQKLTEHYDYVFVDSPPVNVVSDAIVLSNFMSGLLLVARQGYCTYEELAKAVESVRFAKANVLGVVVNATRAKHKPHKSKKYGYYAEN